MTATVQAAEQDLDAAFLADVGDRPPLGPGGDLAVPPPLRSWRHTDPRVGWFITILVTVLAGLTRFWDLTDPKGKIFDEVYYATEAQELLRYGYENNPDYMFIVHPSVGKWCIALTSTIFGNNELGWRMAPAIAGTLSVFMIVRIGRRMFRSNLLGGLAGLLLTMDGVSLVQSRVALLDIFLQLFILAGFGALVVDRDKFRERLARYLADGGDARTRIPPLGPRPWRLLGGVMLGLSCGVKWSALSFAVLFCLLSMAWDVGALKTAGVRYPWSAAWRASWVGAIFSLWLAAIGTYMLTWLGWWAGENSWNRHWADTNHINGFGWLPKGFQSALYYHYKAYEFHSSLYSPHPFESQPWSWLVLGRPILYANYTTSPGGNDTAMCGSKICVSEVLLIGTPLMWWAFIPALLWLTWHWATTRDWRAATVLVAFLAGWAVWLHDIRRTAFLFYMTPLMPYLVLGLTLALGTMLGSARIPSIRMLRYRPNWGLILVALFLGVVIADFVWMYPLFTNIPISHSSFLGHMWFNSWYLNRTGSGD